MDTGKQILSCMKDLLFISLILIIAACLYITIGEKITSDMVFFGGIKPVYIISGSMEPGIKKGAIVLIEKASYEDVDIGDIITFETEDGYVTHRLIGIDNNRRDIGCDDYLITKGDANNVEDMARLNPFRIRGKTVLCLNALSVFQRITVKE